MTRFVVDASVVVKWFLPEEHAEYARRLLNEGFELSSPDLLRAEVGNVLWKRWRRGDIFAEEAGEILRHFRRLPLKIQTSEPLMETAWSVARRFDRSFYDGVYVALAELAGYPLVTADRKLYDALRESDLAEPLLFWVEELDTA